jgi:aspartate/methionine/tyrosine aminotransferase
VEIRPFALERFYVEWEFEAEMMLSSSDCETHAVSDLLDLEPDAEDRLRSLLLGYTEVSGSYELRMAAAALYDNMDVSNVLTVSSAEEGIFLAYHALVAAGDHVVVEAPCYGSAIEVARSTGAAVSLWERRYEDNWEYDVEDLERLLRPETKLVYINTPHNPTGSQMSGEVFGRIIDLARERGIMLLSDEVYRGLEYDVADRLPAACDLYANAISLNTVSKTYGLSGLRIGWVATRNRPFVDRMRDLKLYTTLCSSAPSELLVALALRHSGTLIERSRELIFSNLRIVDEFFDRRSEFFQWVRPSAGPIGFPRVAGDFDVHAWCVETARQTDVLLLPGSVYDMPRHLRVGFGRANLPLAIARLDNYLGNDPLRLSSVCVS